MFREQLHRGQARRRRQAVVSAIRAPWFRYVLLAQREAAEWRAEGEGAARRIRATADRQVTVIKADATGKSERTRGDGDAERNRIYAEAYNQDPEFFGFYRSMQAYETALQAGDTRLLLTPTLNSSNISMMH